MRCHRRAGLFVRGLAQPERPARYRVRRHCLRDLAAGAKALQFALARVVRGREVDLAAILAPMEQNWDDATATMVQHYGG